MALYSLVSPGNSPGVTTTALALALTWPQSAMVAECDPAGRRIVPGYLAERLGDRLGPGLLGLAMAIGHDPDGASRMLGDYVVPLDETGKTVALHGVRDPRHSRQIAAVWQPLAAILASADVDVIADLGRVGSDSPVPLLTAAELIVMVLRRSLPQVDAARPRLDALNDAVRGRVPVALCLVGDGPYHATTIQKALDLPVIAELPDAVADARVLSDGARPRATFRTSMLMRATSKLGRRMRRATEERAIHRGSIPVRPVALRGEP